MSKATFKPKLPVELRVSELLDMRICPGCGKVNPRNFDGKNSPVFTCAKCYWECDEPLPSLQEWTKRRGVNGQCNDVNMGALIRSILKQLS